MDYTSYIEPEQTAGQGIDYREYIGLSDSTNESVEQMMMKLPAGEQVEEEHSWVYDLAVDLVPFAKYAVDPKKREEFSQMQPDQQRNALLWEAFGAALWAVPIPVGFLGKGLFGKLAAKRAAKARQFIKPVEDLAAWTEKSYVQGLDDLLKSKGAGYALRGEERAAVKDYIFGNEHALNGVLGEMAGGKYTTKALQRITELSRDSAGRPSYALRPEVFEKLTPRAIRREQMVFDYKNTLYTKMKLNGPARYKEIYNPRKTSLDKAAFPHVMKEIFGEPGASKTLMTATERELLAAREYLRSPKSAALVKRVAEPGPSALLARVPFAFARGETSYKTLSGVHQPVVDGLAAANAHVSAKSKVLDEMLWQRKLLRLDKKSGKFKIIPERMNREVERKAAVIIQGIKQAEKELSLAETAAARDKLRGGIEKMIAGAGAEGRAVGELVNTYVDFTDHMYGEFLGHYLERTLHTKYLNGKGRTGVDLLLNGSKEMGVEGVRNKIAGIFATNSRFTAAEKNKALNEILSDIRDVVTARQKDWWTFTKPDVDALPHWQRLYPKLKMEEQFPRYSIGNTNYIPQYKGRLLNILHSGPEGRAPADPLWDKLASLGRSHPLSVEREMLKLIRHQAEYTHLFPAMQQAATHARALPPGWVKLTEHLFTRVLNMPSRQDAWTAGLLENTVGHALRALGREGTFDAHDVMNIARRVNDFTYMGFLGFKPFSAMRNLFQPLIMVPTDLGGIKDLPLLSLAYRDVLSRPAVRKAIRDLQVIPEEFTGEFAQYASQALKIRDRVAGVPVPSLEEVKAASLWMFGESHKLNCYVSAAAAMRKWDTALQKIGTNHLGEIKRIGRFMKKSGVSGRRADIRSQIETLLRFGDKGSLTEARKMFITSVVEDTQFVYASTHTPLITQSLGGIGRTASIFQTWWLNYGTTIHKWMTTGALDTKAERAMTAVLSGAMAYGLMRTMWDKEVAAKTVGVGPFPSAGDLFRMPPAWEAMYQTLRTVPALAGLAEGDQPYSEKVTQQIARAARTTFPLAVPGGLQLKQTYTRASEEGMEGFLKSLVRYKKEE